MQNHGCLKIYLAYNQEIQSANKTIIYINTNKIFYNSLLNFQRNYIVKKILNFKIE